MFKFFKQRRASFELEVAVSMLLMGRDDLKALLKTEYASRWPVCVDEIAGGANAFVMALQLIQSLLLGFLADISESQREGIIAVVQRESQSEAPPALFDMIAQIAYYSYLEETDHKVPERTAAAFLAGMTRAFSSQIEVQRRVHEYLVQRTLQFRERAKRALNEGAFLSSISSLAKDGRL